jgi:hypothetical protein
VATAQKQAFTIGDVARRLGVRPWQVRRIFERGILPEPLRFGAYRLLTDTDLPALETALKTVGYLKEESVHAG